MSTAQQPGGARYDAATVTALLRRGSSVWPLVSVSEQALTEHLAAVLEGTPVSSEQLHTDLVLACGCLLGDRNAQLALESSVIADVPLAVRRVCSEQDFVHEVIADLRLRLLCSEGDKPALLRRYQGRGPLRSFVMVLAMRAALDRKRRTKELATEMSVFERLAAEDGSLAGEAAELQREFLGILSEKLRALPLRDRTVLRLNAVEGLSVDVLARMYNVHRATIARWVASAKLTVFEQTQAELRARRSWSDATFQSFARDAADNMDATLSSFLGGLKER